MPSTPTANQQRKAIAKQRAAIMAKARAEVEKDWEAVEVRQAIDAEASRQLVREHRAMDAVLAQRAEAIAAARAAATNGDDNEMATETKANKQAAVRKTAMSDEQVVAFIAKQLGKDPDAGVSTVYKALRAAGNSCSGGRVRNLFEQGRKAATSGRVDRAIVKSVKKSLAKGAVKNYTGKAKPSKKAKANGEGVTAGEPVPAAATARSK